MVVLKLCEFDGKRPPFAQIAEELSMSVSEVHGAVKRAQAAHLLHCPELGERPTARRWKSF
jgi:DNA-binding Lrp family transcriptional regulator